MRFLRTFVVGLLLLGFASIAMAEVKLPAIIGSNMVLQRGEKVPVWGWSEPGTEVQVQFDGKTTKATADNDGRWQVMLGPFTVGEPKTMVIETNKGDKVQLDNILVGEVWICSGQSNMGWPMSATFNAEEEVAAANYSKLRLFKVQQAISQEPSKDCNGSWTECSPQNVSNFSAVGYYFARKLHKDLDVPVGIIDSSWGGTIIETWMPIESIEPEIAKSVTNWWKATFGDKPNDPNCPATLYNGMIHPLIPYGIRGAIWYQGEGNRHVAAQYGRLFPAMIDAWRRLWNKPEMPFGFVQLAPYRYDTMNGEVNNGREQLLPEFWEMQSKTAQNIPAVGMAVITDVTNLTDIHPRKKEPVGDRLALWALATVYDKDLVYSGPIYKSMKIEGDKIRLSFDHVGSGLKTSDGKPLDYFTIAGDDKKYYPAEAVIDGETIVVSSPEVKEPVAVRFGWHEAATPNFVNKEGLPASPFRTDQPQ